MELLIFRACWYSEVDLFTKSLYLYFVSIRFAYKFLDFMIDVLNYFSYSGSIASPSLSVRIEFKADSVYSTILSSWTGTDGCAFEDWLPCMEAMMGIESKEENPFLRKFVIIGSSI